MQRGFEGHTATSIQELERRNAELELALADLQTLTSARDAELQRRRRSHRWSMNIRVFGRHTEH
jgi:hypothetical protein